MSETVEIVDVQIGDRIRFRPDSRPDVWWLVTARDEAHVVAVRQAPFEPKGTVEYTVTAVWDFTYNNAGPGLVRSSLNTMGGGWDLAGRIDAASAEILNALARGEYSLSTRRVIGVNSIERQAH